jgi:hypothetical protein
VGHAGRNGQADRSARGEKEIVPAIKIRELALGQLSDHDWLAWLNELGIADRELVPAELRAPEGQAKSAGPISG